MRLQKRRPRPKAFWQADGLAVALGQGALCKRIQLRAAQVFGHADGLVGQHRDQALVIGAVVQGRQAQAVAGVQAVFATHAPRLDVARHVHHLERHRIGRAAQPLRQLQIDM